LRRILLARQKGPLHSDTAARVVVVQHHTGPIVGQPPAPGRRQLPVIADQDPLACAWWAWSSSRVSLRLPSALGRPQDQIQGGDRVAAVGAAEQLAGRGVAALEHGLEPGHGCFALQAEAGGGGAVPSSWRLAVAGQVLLVVGSEFAGDVGSS
jgi:hypothetical protein